MLSSIDEIKSKVDIVDLLSEYVKLKQAGVNWKANCPFHHEKTPSFMVSRDKQIWHCFGCGEGGDIFTFVQKIEGLDFSEALSVLAKKAGVILQHEDPSITNQRTRLVDINDLAARYYHKVLLESSIAQSARDYLAARSVDAATIDEWQLGYAPDSWDQTSNFLKKKGYTEQEIFLAGLSVRKEKGAGFYDRFRGRLTFPIRDHNGRVVGFSARTLDPDAKEAKYVNTPQTPIFNKGQLLFGLDKAKQEIRKQKVAVLVEGNLDVITSHQYGVKNVIASCGTALTIDHTKLIKRYTENLSLCFDPDTAGQLAAERGIDIALLEGMNVRVITLPDGEDPDKFIKNNNADVWRARVTAAVPVMDYYFDKSVVGADITRSEIKKELVAKLLPVVAKISDQVSQAHWLQQLAEKLSIPENILREALSGLMRKIVPSRDKAVPVLHSQMSRQEMMSEQFFALMFNFPDLMPLAVERIAPDALFGDKSKDLYTSLIIYYNNNRDSLTGKNNQFMEGFTSYLDKGLAEYLNQMTLLISKDSEDINFEQARGEIVKIIKDLKKEYINSELQKLREQIKIAEKAGDSNEVKKLSEQFSYFTDQLYNLS
ncbi:MAG: DNA primase [Patescibacteria group bacterium]